MLGLVGSIQMKQLQDCWFSPNFRSVLLERTVSDWHSDDTWLAALVVTYITRLMITLGHGEKAPNADRL